MAVVNNELLSFDYDDEREASAKEFQRSLNSPRPHAVRRLVRQTADPGHAGDPAHKRSDSKSGRTSSRHSAAGVVEDVPVFRELEEWNPKWRRVFNTVCPQPIRSALSPPASRAGWIQFMLVHLPILQWVWRYTPKQLIGDTVAGLTIGVTHIPQGMQSECACCHSLLVCVQEGIPLTVPWNTAAVNPILALLIHCFVLLCLIQVLGLLCWLLYLLRTDCTAPSYRPLSTQSLEHPDTSQLVGEEGKSGMEGRMVERRERLVYNPGHTHI